jgi:gas vesicle protein GvpL/GvpF
VNHYVYAIVERLPGRWRPPMAGLAGASVVPRRCDGLVVLSSLLDTVPAPSPRSLALHQDVVATLVDAPATLPMPYGTTVPLAELPGWLTGHRTTVTTALRAVRGCVEMTVKLLRLEGAIAGRPDMRGGSHPDGPSPEAPGEAELRALAEALADRAALPHWRYRPSGTAGNVTAAVAFLVPRRDLAGFLARIAPVASHAAGVAVVPTGPWVPYSFVPELDRTPPARVPAGILDMDGRRAG